MQGEQCNQTIPSASLFCNFCGSKQTEVVNQLYQNPFGCWKVTTQGDEEGRTTRQLGTHEGYIDEIAHELADKANYNLVFVAVPKLGTPKTIVPRRKEVMVQLDIDSKTWNMDEKQRVEFFKKLLAGRPVEIEPSTYYGCVKLSFKNTKAVK